MIYVASDHGGYNLKTELINYFQQNNLAYEDLGAYEQIPDDDYPTYALPLVQRVRANEGSYGILICRNGVGVNMLANKFKGIRAGLSWNTKHAIKSRGDDHTNVLTLPADYIDAPTAMEVVKVWLETPYSNEERHLRRTGEVDRYGQE